MSIGGYGKTMVWALSGVAPQMVHGGTASLEEVTAWYKEAMQQLAESERPGRSCKWRQKTRSDAAGEELRMARALKLLALVNKRYDPLLHMTRKPCS